MVINENSSIYELTDGQCSSIRYNSAGTNYTGPLIKAIVNMIDKTGCDVTNTQVHSTSSVFRDIILNYQKQFGLAQTGIVDDDLLHDIYNRAYNNSNDEIIYDDEYSELNNENSEDDVYDAHYDPFFLNNSGKSYRRNHKDIIISFGNDAKYKCIKDVFMRSVSVQVDTSGNPISEVYSFIARDIKESDAPEDLNKYVGEERNISASSDIKYSYETLFKDH